MKDYRQGAFRNAFEQHLFETVRDALAWCASYAAKEGFPRSVKGEVYHNVQTAEFHGELSVAASRADTTPLSKPWSSHAVLTVRPGLFQR
jgi:hypothetical protein